MGLEKKVECDVGDVVILETRTGEERRFLYADPRGGNFGWIAVPTTRLSGKRLSGCLWRILPPLEFSRGEQWAEAKLNEAPDLKELLTTRRSVMAKFDQLSHRSQRCIASSLRIQQYANNDLVPRRKDSSVAAPPKQQQNGNLKRQRRRRRPLNDEDDDDDPDEEEEEFDETKDDEDEASRATTLQYAIVEMSKNIALVETVLAGERSKTKLTYGAALCVQHVLTGKLLIARPEVAGENGCLKVELISENRGDSRCLFHVFSGQQGHAEGHPVHARHHIQLCSQLTKDQTEPAVLRASSSNYKEQSTCEANLAMTPGPDAWISLLPSCDRGPFDDPNRIDFGQYVRILNREREGFLVAPARSFFFRKAEIVPYFRHSRFRRTSPGVGCWILEREDPVRGGKLVSNANFRLRHACSGRYAAVSYAKHPDCDASDIELLAMDDIAFDNSRTIFQLVSVSDPTLDQIPSTGHACMLKHTMRDVPLYLSVGGLMKPSAATDEDDGEDADDDGEGDASHKKAVFAPRSSIFDAVEIHTMSQDKMLVCEELLDVKRACTALLDLLERVVDDILIEKMSVDDINADLKKQPIDPEFIAEQCYKTEEALIQLIRHLCKPPREGWPDDDEKAKKRDKKSREKYVESIIDMRHPSHEGNQHLARDMKFMEDLVEMIYTISLAIQSKGGFEHFSAPHRKQLSAFLLSIRLAYAALKRCVVNNRISQVYFYQKETSEVTEKTIKRPKISWVSLIFQNVIIGVGATRLLTALIERNMSLNRRVITSQRIQGFIDLIKRLGPRPDLLHLMAMTCRCDDGKAAKENQDKYLTHFQKFQGTVFISTKPIPQKLSPWPHKLRREPANRYLAQNEATMGFPTIFIRWASIADWTRGAEGALYYRPEDMGLTTTYDGNDFVDLKDLARVLDDDFYNEEKAAASSNERKDHLERQRKIASYYVEQIYLLAAMCLDQEYNAISHLETEYSYATCLWIIAAKTTTGYAYPEVVRTAFATLLLHLHVIRYPHQPHAGRSFIPEEVWIPVDSTTDRRLDPKDIPCFQRTAILHVNGQDVDESPEKFILLLNVIEGHLAEKTTENATTLSLLRILECLVDFGFVSTLPDLRAIAEPLLHVLKREIPRSQAKPTTDDAYDAENILFETKACVIRTLSTIHSFIQQCRLRCALTEYQALVASADDDKAPPPRKKPTTKVYPADQPPESRRQFTKRQLVSSSSFLELFNNDDDQSEECNLWRLCNVGDPKEVDVMLRKLMRSTSDEVAQTVWTFLTEYRRERHLFLERLAKTVVLRDHQVRKLHGNLTRIVASDDDETNDIIGEPNSALTTLKSMICELTDVIHACERWLNGKDGIFGDRKDFTPLWGALIALMKPGGSGTSKLTKKDVQLHQDILLKLGLAKPLQLCLQLDASTVVENEEAGKSFYKFTALGAACTSRFVAGHEAGQRVMVPEIHRLALDLDPSQDLPRFLQYTDVIACTFDANPDLVESDGHDVLRRALVWLREYLKKVVEKPREDNDAEAIAIHSIGRLLEIFMNPGFSHDTVSRKNQNIVAEAGLLDDDVANKVHPALLVLFDDDDDAKEVIPASLSLIHRSLVRLLARSTQNHHASNVVRCARLLPASQVLWALTYGSDATQRAYMFFLLHCLFDVGELRAVKVTLSEGVWWAIAVQCALLALPAADRDTITRPEEWLTKFLPRSAPRKKQFDEYRSIIYKTPLPSESKEGRPSFRRGRRLSFLLPAAILKDHSFDDNDKAFRPRTLRESTDATSTPMRHVALEVVAAFAYRAATTAGDRPLEGQGRDLVAVFARAAGAICRLTTWQDGDTSTVEKLKVLQSVFVVDHAAELRPDLSLQMGIKYDDTDDDDDDEKRRSSVSEESEVALVAAAAKKQPLTVADFVSTIKADPSVIRALKKEEATFLDILEYLHGDDTDGDGGDNSQEKWIDLAARLVSFCDDVLVEKKKTLHGARETVVQIFETMTSHLRRLKHKADNNTDEAFENSTAEGRRSDLGWFVTAMQSPWVDVSLLILISAAVILELGFPNLASNLRLTLSAILLVVFTAELIAQIVVHSLMLEQSWWAGLRDCFRSKLRYIDVVSILLEVDFMMTHVVSGQAQWLRSIKYVRLLRFIKISRAAALSQFLSVAFPSMTKIIKVVQDERTEAEMKVKYRHIYREHQRLFFDNKTVEAGRVLLAVLCDEHSDHKLRVAAIDFAIAILDGANVEAQQFFIRGLASSEFFCIVHSQLRTAAEIVPRNLKARLLKPEEEGLHRKNVDLQSVIHYNRLFQALLAGQQREMQDIMQQQKGLFKSVDLISDLAQFIGSFFELRRNALKVIVKLTEVEIEALASSIEVLTASMLGAHLGNQKTVATGSVSDHLSSILSLPATSLDTIRGSTRSRRVGYLVARAARCVATTLEGRDAESPIHAAWKFLDDGTLADVMLAAHDNRKRDVKEERSWSRLIIDVCIIRLKLFGSDAVKGDYELLGLGHVDVASSLGDLFVERVIFELPSYATSISKVAKKNFDETADLTTTETRLRSLFFEGGKAVVEQAAHLATVSRVSKLYRDINANYNIVKIGIYGISICLTLHILLTLSGPGTWRSSFRREQRRDVDYGHVQSPRSFPFKNILSLVAGTLVSIGYCTLFVFNLVKNFRTTAHRHARKFVGDKKKKHVSKKPWFDGHQEKKIPCALMNAGRVLLDKRQRLRAHRRNLRLAKRATKAFHVPGAATILVYVALVAVYALDFGFGHELQIMTIVVFVAWVPQFLRGYFTDATTKAQLLYNVIYDTFATNHEAQGNLFCSCVAIGGFFWQYLWSFLLLDILLISDVLKNLLKAVWQPRVQLLLALYALVVFTILFSVTIYMLNFSYKNSSTVRPVDGPLEEEDEDEDDFASSACDTPWICVLRDLWHGLVDGQIYTATLAMDYFDGVSPTEAMRRRDNFYRVVTQLAFFVTVTLLLLGVVTGIILDKFSSLREELNTRKEKMAGECFVCGLDEANVDIARHERDEHDKFHYLLFLAYLEEKKTHDPTSLTGHERYVADCVDKGILSWVPSKTFYGHANRQK